MITRNILISLSFFLFLSLLLVNSRNEEYYIIDVFVFVFDFFFFFFSPLSFLFHSLLQATNTRKIVVGLLTEKQILCTTVLYRRSQGHKYMESIDRREI